MTVPFLFISLGTDLCIQGIEIQYATDGFDGVGICRGDDHRQSDHREGEYTKFRKRDRFQAGVTKSRAGFHDSLVLMLCVFVRALYPLQIFFFTAEKKLKETGFSKSPFLSFR